MSERVWEWLVGQTLGVTVLVLLVLAARRVLGRRVEALWWHALWVVVALRVVVPWVPATALSVWNFERVEWGRIGATAMADLSGEVPGVREVERESGLLGVGEERFGQVDRVELVGGSGGLVEGAEVGVVVRGGESGGGVVGEREVVVDGGWEGIGWRAGLLGIWGCGVVVFGGCWVCGLVRRGRFLGRARELVDGVWVDGAVAAGQAMGVERRVRVMASGEIGTPGVCGWWRPVVVVPEAPMSALEVRHVMMHELGHVKRGDGFWVALMQVAVVLQWFNPMVWWARRCLVRDRELACDAMVLRRLGEEGVADYGTTLLRVAARMRSGDYLVPMLGIAQVVSELRGRVVEVIGWQKSGIWRRWFSGLVACGVVMVGATGAVRPVVVPFEGLALPGAGEVQVAVAAVDLPVEVVGEVLMGGSGGVERVMEMILDGDGEVIGEAVASGRRGGRGGAVGATGLWFEAGDRVGRLEVKLRAWATNREGEVGVFDGVVSGEDGEVVLAGAMGGGGERCRVVLVRLAEGVDEQL